MQIQMPFNPFKKTKNEVECIDYFAPKYKCLVVQQHHIGGSFLIKELEKKDTRSSKAIISLSEYAPPEYRRPCRVEFIRTSFDSFTLTENPTTRLSQIEGYTVLVLCFDLTDRSSLEYWIKDLDLNTYYVDLVLVGLKRNMRDDILRSGGDGVEYSNVVTREEGVAAAAACSAYVELSASFDTEETASFLMEVCRCILF